MSEIMRVATNGHWRELVPNPNPDPDMGDEWNALGFMYRGEWWSLFDFNWFPNEGPVLSDLRHWTHAFPQSYWDAIVIRYDSDHWDRVQVGHAMW